MSEPDEAWHSVWNDRLPDKDNWNGYEATFADGAAYQKWIVDLVELITSALQLEESDNVIDLGCGTGRSAGIVALSVNNVNAYDYLVDFNTITGGFFGASMKGYAFGVIFNLKIVEHVLGIVSDCENHGGAVPPVDFPEAALSDDSDRGYERQRFSHLPCTEYDFKSSFDGCCFLRDCFEEYAYDAVRFSMLVPPQSSGSESDFWGPLK